MLKAAFLVSIIATIALTALNAFGYDVLDYVIGMMVVSFLTLCGYLELENKKIVKETKEFMGTRLEGIEKICGETLEHLKALNPDVDTKLEKHKGDVNYMLDRMARKSLDIEERLNAFGRILSSNLGLESQAEQDTIVQEAEIVPEVANVQDQIEESYNVGEIVYVEEEEKEKEIA